MYCVAGLSPVSEHVGGLAVAGISHVFPPAETLYTFTPSLTAFGSTVTLRAVGKSESTDKSLGAEIEKQAA